MIDPVAFSIAGIDVYWYGIVYALGFIITLWFLKRYSSKLNLTNDQIDTIVIVTMITGLIGARMAHILFYEPSYFLSNITEIIRIDKGGMSIHGGLIGGIIGLKYITRKYNLSIFKITDIVVIPLTLALTFGRIANFINQELVGKITTSPIGVVFELYDSKNRYPSQLFESVKNMIVFQILLFSYYFRNLRNGELTAYFLILYNGLRFIVDFTRKAEVSIGILSMGQLLSAIGTIVGIVFLIYLRKDIFSKKFS